jgi:small basic protein (TIGR04137 family)
MSIHKSLALKSSLVRSRNVLTRYERILQLRKSGKWTEGESTAFGLQKVRVLKAKKRVKEKKKDEAAAVPGAPGAAAAPAAAKAAAPAAAGAKAAAPAGKGAAPAAAGKAAAPAKK